MEENIQIIDFQGKNIRRVMNEGEWFFSVVDVIAILSESKDPSDYWTTLKKRDNQLPTICRKLKLLAADGKKRLSDCANLEGMFRIIMSVPSPQAEPFKRWLAKVGKERIDEIKDPGLAAERARRYYKAKGYDDAWIEMRLKSIEVRGQLTDEWKGRGVQEGKEYSILTAEISKATFGITPSEYKEIKDLKNENVRDHMTNLELIFTMLGEETARTKTVSIDAIGFEENQKAAIEGGTSAGKALDAFEKDSGVKVVTSSNFKAQIQEAKKKQKALDSGKKED
jgi:hypothetical protein